jgi:regulator of protease activity HflC (stomatin/prohibitin superfamily)
MSNQKERPDDESLHPEGGGPDYPDRDPDARTFRDRMGDLFRRTSVYSSIVVLMFTFFFLLLSDRIVYNIKPGERGVRWSRFGGGTVLDQEYGEGVRLIAPWDELFIYNVRVQEIHDTIVVLSANGLPITVDYSARYQPDRSNVPALHQTYGPNYADVVVQPQVVAALREVVGNYRPEQIYAQDEAGLLDEIYNVLAAGLTNRYVIIQNLLIKELRLTPELEAAINQKLVDDQDALAYEFRLRREESERARKRIEAEGIRDFEATADISILQWRGIEATMALAESQNSKIIVIGTGDGQLPVILGGQ